MHRRRSQLRALVIVTFAVLSLAGCKRSGSGSATRIPPPPPILEVHGTTIIPGATAALWVSLSGSHAATLVDPFRPGGAGELRVGRLTVAPVAGGAPVKLAESVSDLPGSVQLSGDGRRVVFRTWSPGLETGDLRLSPTSGGEGERLDTNVKSFALSPDDRFVAWLSGDALKVRPLEGGPVRTVTEGVLLMQWGPRQTPAAHQLLVQRGAGSRGALLRYDAAAQRLTALGEGASRGDFSADGSAVVFVASKLLGAAETARVQGSASGASALYWARGDGAPRRLTDHEVVTLRVSPDGRRVAWTEPSADGMGPGMLMLSVDGGAPKAAARTVKQFVFAPDGTIGALGGYVADLQAGTLVLLPPEGGLEEVARNVRTFSFSPHGRWVLYLHGMGNTTVLEAFPVKGLPGRKPRGLEQGVMGYLVDDSEEYVTYKARCIDGTVGCSLFTAPLAGDGAPLFLAQRVAAFDLRPDGAGYVVMTSRPAPAREAEAGNTAAPAAADHIFAIGTLPRRPPAAGALDAELVSYLESVAAEEFVVTSDGSRRVVYRVDRGPLSGIAVAAYEAP